MKKILFICTGNTCRSPMAEAIARKLDKNLEVKSAGLFAVQGSDISPFAKEVLQENDIVHQHQSTPFTKEVADWADLILTMTKSHKDYIVGQYPDLRHKVFSLKEFVKAEGMDVSDPYGGSIDTYRRTYQELYDLITKLEDKLY